MNKIIINVGRQIGSGGHIIAEKLAEDFGCKCYDRELLNLAAKESGFSEKFFEQNDEQKGFFKSLFHTHLPFLSDNNFSPPDHYGTKPNHLLLDCQPSLCSQGDKLHAELPQYSHTPNIS